MEGCGAGQFLVEMEKEKAEAEKQTKEKADKSDRQLSDVMNEEEQKTRLFHPHHFTKTGKTYSETKADALRAALAFRRGLEMSKRAKDERAGLAAVESRCELKGKSSAMEHSEDPHWSCSEGRKREAAMLVADNANLKVKEMIKRQTEKMY